MALLKNIKNLFGKPEVAKPEVAEKEFNFDEIFKHMQEASELNGISEEFVYDFKSLNYNKKAKNKKWKVSLVRVVGYSDMGFKDKRNQISFENYEDALKEFNKYKAKKFTIFNENMQVEKEGNFQTEEEKEVEFAFLQKYCPNAMGVGL